MFTKFFILKIAPYIMTHTLQKQGLINVLRMYPKCFWVHRDWNIGRSDRKIRFAIVPATVTEIEFLHYAAPRSSPHTWVAQALGSLLP